MDKIYTWAIQGALANDKYKLRKAKILVNVHAIALVLLLFSIILALFIDRRYVMVFSGVFVGVFASLLSFRKWQSFLITGNIFILICTVSSLNMIYNFGGYQSTYMVWLFMIPIYSFTIASRKSAVFWFCTTFLLILLILFYFPTSISADVTTAQLKFIIGINMISFFIFIFVMEFLAGKERDRLISALEFEKKQTQAIMNKIPAGLAYIDKNLCVQYYNPVLDKFFRLGGKDATGKPIKDIIGERYYEINLPYYLRALEGETVVYERHVGKPEDPLFIRCIYVPRFNQEGEVIGFVNLIADLTKLKEAEELKLKAKEAQKVALSNKLNFRNRELTSQELFITNQKELLKEIKQSLRDVTTEVESTSKNKLRKIIRTIDQNMNLEDEWENFKLQFERLHPDFIDRLQAKYAKLNTRELRHCSYIKMRLSNKEIARIQNLSLKSVEMSNYRLKKKLQLKQDITLSEFISTF